MFINEHHQHLSPFKVSTELPSSFGKGERKSLYYYTIWSDQVWSWASKPKKRFCTDLRSIFGTVWRNGGPNIQLEWARSCTGRTDQSIEWAARLTTTHVGWKPVSWSFPTRHRGHLWPDYRPGIAKRADWNGDHEGKLEEIQWSGEAPVSLL